MEAEEYLTELAMIRTQEVILRDNGVDPEKIKAEALCFISHNASILIVEFFKIRDKGISIPARSRKKILDALLEIAKWSAAILMFNGVEIMSMEEIEGYAMDFDDDLLHDGVLAGINIQAGVTNLSDALYIDSDLEIDEDELSQGVAEILALTCILSNRVECPFEGLLTGSF